MASFPSLRDRVRKPEVVLGELRRDAGLPEATPPAAFRAAAVAVAPGTARAKRVVRLRVADLVVPSYQTKVHRLRVKELLAGWDDAAIGTLEVSLRDDRYWLVDGQHRQAVLLAQGRGDELVECVLHEGLTLAEEADLYTKLANRRAKAYANVHRAGVIAGDPVATATDDLLRERGLATTDPSGTATGWSPGAVSAVKVLEQIVGRHGEEHAGDVLDTCRAIWGEAKGAYNRFALTGVSQFLRAYPAVPRERIAERLRANAVTPRDFEDQARRIKLQHGGGQAGTYGAGRAVLHFVNQRSTKKLPNVFEAFAAHEESERRRQRAARPGA